VLVIFGDKEVDLKECSQHLMSQAQEFAKKHGVELARIIVVVQADKRVPSAAVMRLVEIGREGGLHDFRLAAIQGDAGVAPQHPKDARIGEFKLVEAEFVLFRDGHDDPKVKRVNSVFIFILADAAGYPTLIEVGSSSSAFVRTIPRSDLAARVKQELGYADPKFPLGPVKQIVFQVTGTLGYEYLLKAIGCCPLSLPVAVVVLPVQ
jgi:hypothetical protein